MKMIKYVLLRDKDDHTYDVDVSVLSSLCSVTLYILDFSL